MSKNIIACLFILILISCSKKEMDPCIGQTPTECFLDSSVSDLYGITDHKYYYNENGKLIQFISTNNYIIIDNISSYNPSQNILKQVVTHKYSWSREVYYTYNIYFQYDQHEILLNTTSTDADSHSVKYFRDSLNRIQRIETSLNSIFEFYYNEEGLLIEQVHSHYNLKWVHKISYHEEIPDPLHNKTFKYFMNIDACTYPGANVNPPTHIASNFTNPEMFIWKSHQIDYYNYNQLQESITWENHALETNSLNYLTKSQITNSKGFISNVEYFYSCQ